MNYLVYFSCIVATLLLLLPVPAQAIPTITCHCFTDRSYDPKRPTLADSYFMASVQNSFFAGVFGIDKKIIVIKKQQGAASDDLWLAYWLAQKSGLPVELLFQKRQKLSSWLPVFKQTRVQPKTSDPRLAEALQENATDARLAEAVVDTLLLRHKLLQETVLTRLRNSGAGSKELIITALIAAKSGADPEQVYHDVKKGSSSWGGKLQQAKITSQNLQQEITTLLRL